MIHTQIEKVYLALLQLAPVNDFRIHNQDIYARVRDYIAQGRKKEPQEIQDYFEGLGNEIVTAEAGIKANKEQ